MTKQDNEPQNLQIRKIRRKQIYLGLAIAAGLGFLLYRCVDENETHKNPSSSPLAAACPR